MAEHKQGTVTVVYDDGVPIPENAGKLKPEEVQRLAKARRGVGMTCSMTAATMRKYPEKLTVAGVSPDGLEQAGYAAEQIDLIITDLDAALTYFKQGNSLLDADAHTQLRKVLTHVRGAEKFDAHVVDLVPQLIAYFASERPSEEKKK